MAEETIIDLLQIKIEKAKDKLPGTTKVAIGSLDWQKAIDGIKEKKGYNEEQIDALKLETELLLAGLLNPDNYITELVTRMKITKPQAETLVAEINSLVFEKIKDELIKIIDRRSMLVENIATKKKEESLEDKVRSENLVPEKPDPRFTNLPENIKDIITESNYPAKIYVLGKENNLTIAQITNLGGLVTDTILGTVHPDSFETKTRSITGLSEDKLKILVGEINNKVLKEIRIKILGLEQNAKGVVSVEPLSKQLEVKTPETTSTVNTVVAPAVPIVKAVPNINIVNSIAFNKLSGAVKSTGAVTEYSLNNISKTNEQNKQGNSSAGAQKVDPYRMPVE